MKLATKRTWAVVIILTVLLFTTALFWHELPFFSAAALLAMVVILAWLVFKFKLQLFLIKSIALLLPFSIEVPFVLGSMLRVPTEPLIGVALMVLYFDVAHNPGEWLRSKLSKEHLWTIPLLSVLLVTVPFSEMLFVSIKFSFVNIAYILVFYVFMARYLRDYPGMFHSLIMMYGIGYLIVAGYGLFRFWQWDWNPLVVRGIFQPFYKDHTIFGASGALLAGYCIAMLKAEKRKQMTIIYLISGLVFIAAVLLSSSRAAFLSLVFFLLVLFLFRLKINFRQLILTGLASIILLVVLYKPTLEHIQKAEFDNGNNQSGIIDRTRSVANITTDVSNLERINRWISAWRMFLEKPVTGFGPGTYQFKYIPYQDPAYMTRLTVHDHRFVPEGSGGTAHSEYLLALSEMGIIGLFGWLLLMGRWVYLSFSRKAPPGCRKVYVQIAFAALSTYLFHAFFNNFLTTDKFAFLFWGTAAWLIANNYKTDEQIV